MGEPLVLGRAEADLTIDDPLVSRRHAVVRPHPAGIEIEDLGSLNGTFVNDEQVESVRQLQPGDVIRIGSTTAEVIPDDPAAVGTVLAPSPVAQRPAAPAGPVDDELRTITALFADVVGSTTLGERLAPHEVKAVVGEAVTRMSREVERFGGWVQAYMGDGIAVFFGVPTVHEDDPERAARAALAVRDAIAEYAHEVEADWGIAGFSARVGINTGQVAVGLVGAADPQPVSLGDATNVAARLQGLAEPGTIAVGDATAKALIHRFSLEFLGELSLKGREQAVSAWRLLSADELAPRQDRAPLVDREEELATLARALDELVDGRGQVLLLTGEAGIGKTRLLGELRALAADRATWLEGHCFSFGTERPYEPFIGLLRAWIGAEEGGDDAAVRSRLAAKLDLVPGLDAGTELPYLERLLGFVPDGPGVPPADLGSGIRRAYTRWVESLAARAPVVVALEDLQWADRSTCDLAGELLELTDRAPLLIAATQRPDPGSRGWALQSRIHADYPHRVVEARLGPLPDAAARELLELLPGVEKLDPGSRAVILATAEGNPLYLQELAIGFTEGAAERRGQTWAPSATFRGVLTPTLENLMVSQIDRLAPRTRRLAQTAAVVGRQFPRRLLEHLAAEGDLTAELTELLRAGVIREAARYPEPEYAFRHGLLRQAALSSLPPPRQRELYGAAAAAAEALYAGALDDHLELLAHYFGRSNDLAKALGYLERAAERALALGATDDAAELWRSALGVIGRMGGDPVAEQRVRERLDAVSS